MEIYIGIAVAIIIILVIKIIYDKRSSRRKIIYRLKQRWGEVPKDGFSEDKLQAIGHYYETIVRKDTDVDDITWHDLDMNQIYFTINNTCSSVGEEYLYAMLRSLKFSDEKLKERDALAEYFTEHEEDRINVQIPLLKIGKLNSLSVHEYINRLDDLPEEDNMKHYTNILLLVAAVALTFFNTIPGILSIIGVVIYNVVTYFKRKTEIERYFNIVSFILRWLDSAKEISSLDIEFIKKDREKIAEIYKTFSILRRGASVVTPKSAAGDLGQTLFDYVRMFTHIDLIKFNKMIQALSNHRDDLNRLFAITGKLDATIAVASFRILMEGEWCRPVLVSGGRSISTENIYHPMLNDPVKNSITDNRSGLITGSNASGKSTFIKTLAINAILAQTIYTVMADSYRASYFKVMSSMALADNLEDGESYYIVEIKSLKRILDSISSEVPVLCFVDEVLRGTNTLERIAASSRILYTLATSNAICFAATHDIELTYILEKYYSNYHFQEQVIDNEVVFDYVLNNGRAISRNAIKLLSMIGYSDDIIKNADKAAADFLECGEWKAL